MKETIAAIATPRGEGGISVLRVSGPNAKEILFSLCPKLKDSLPPGRLSLQTLDWRQTKGDEALVVFFAAPNSYTGEDVAEIHAHGGSYNTQKILSWLLEAGATLARPGEFTRRAFENGRVDLSQADAIADLISARSEGAHRLALRSMGGVLRDSIESLQNQIVECLAEIEAAIDFPEEDLSFLSGPLVAGVLQAVQKECCDLASTYYAGRLLREGAEVALLGRPNVGKSSLLNALLGEDRAIVTAEAGTTRDAIQAELQLENIKITLVDTAGIRQEESEAEKIGVARSRTYLQEAELRLILFDGSQALCQEDLDILEAARSQTHLLVQTKSDLGLVWSVPEVHVNVSSKTGEGLPSLRKQIASIITEDIDLNAEVIISHIRYRDALINASHSIEKALESITKNKPLELMAEDLYTARANLAEITGRRTRNEVLDEVFRRFCIGK